MALPDEIRAQRNLPRLPEPRERRRIRQAAGVSLARAARELGVSTAALYAWETGQYGPRPARIPAYAKLLTELAAATEETP